MLEGLKRLIFNTDIDDVSEEGELEEIQLPKKEPEPEAPKPPKPEPQPQPQPEKAAEEEKQAEQEQPFTGIVADDEKEKALRAERKARNEQRMSGRRSCMRTPTRSLNSSRSSHRSTGTPQMMSASRRMSMTLSICPRRRRAAR